jgi:hypothetical protein
MEATSTRLTAVGRLVGAAALAIAGAALLHDTAHAATHRVGLIVEHSASWSGGTILTRCVQFAGDAISGLSLLELAGVNSGQPPQVYDWGGGALTVCQIAGEPATVPSRCFGPISGPNWSDWSVVSGQWLRRPTGVTGYTVHDGDVEGWTYTSGFGSRPPAVSFQQVCAAPVQRPAPAVATPRPAPTPSASSSATASPSVIALPPSPTPAPTPKPRPSASPSAAEPLGVLAGSLLVLAGLTAWNLWRRGP